MRILPQGKVIKIAACLKAHKILMAKHCGKKTIEMWVFFKLNSYSKTIHNTSCKLTSSDNNLLLTYKDNNGIITLSVNV